MEPFPDPGQIRILEVLKKQYQKDPNTALNAPQMRRALAIDEGEFAVLVADLEERGFIRSEAKCRGNLMGQLGITVSGRDFLHEFDSKAVREKESERARFEKAEYDVFICHASEDKGPFVAPLAHALRNAGVKVWYDDFSLEWGSGLRQSIEKGLADCRYGIVVLSPQFFKKHWPQRELDGLAAKERKGQKVILPIWHDIGKEDIAKKSPMLADTIAIPSERGISFVVREFKRFARAARNAITEEDSKPAENRLSTGSDTVMGEDSDLISSATSADAGFDSRADDPLLIDRDSIRRGRWTGHGQYRTVLILGAGASQPYGFPVGKSLVREICTEFPRRIGTVQGHVASPEQYSAAAQEFCLDLDTSGCETIDSFLAFRPKLEKIGRVAIASLLLPHEEEDKLSNTYLNQQNDDNWYQRLVNWLAPPTPRGIPKDRVTIVTYNYDRSLEMYLFRTWRTRYGVDQAAGLVKKVKIIHVHGSFGRLEWQDGDDDPVPYNYDVVSRDRNLIIRAANNIKVITDANIENSLELRQAQRAIEDAEVLLFLGFRYDPINLDRLKLPGRLRKDAHVEGTGFGLSAEERRRVEDRPEFRALADGIRIRDRKNLAFLRDCRWF